MHLVIIIPAYNEARVIADVVAGLPKKLPGVTKITPLVVDDNSSDDTREQAIKAGAKVVRHEVNLGAGGATITGFEAAKMLDADLVVTIDADGQHDPKDMPALIQPIVDGEVEVVLGSRLLKIGKGMPFYKKIGNNLLNMVTFVFFGIWMSDSQSGYKAFSRKAIETIELSTAGYEFCSEICGQLKEKKLSFKEVPIRAIYTDYSRSKGQLALNAINIVLGLLGSKLMR